MQISKLFSVFCAIAFCVTFITVRADDNPAQAAARAALEETTRNLDTQQVNTATVELKAKKEAEEAAAKSQAEADKVAAEAKAAQENPPAVIAKTIPTPTTTNNPPATPAPGAAPIQTPEPVIPTAPIQTNDLSKPTPLPILVTSSNVVVVQPSQPTPAVSAVEPAPAKPEEAKAKQAVAETKADEQKAPDKVQTEAQKAAAPAAGENYPGKELKPEPIEAPALPISSVKQTQLQDLLAKYKADLITAGQYQAGRTKILADP